MIKITAFSCFASYVCGARDLLLSLLKVEAPFYSFSVYPLPRMRMRYPSGNCVPNIYILNCGTVLHAMCAERLEPCLLKPKSSSFCTHLYANWSVVTNEPISGKCWHNVCPTCVNASSCVVFVETKVFLWVCQKVVLVQLRCLNF